MKFVLDDFIKIMILDIILDFFKTQLPLIMAVVYLYGYEKNKIENLVKFFVLRTMLSVVEFIFVKLFLFDLYRLVDLAGLFTTR